MSRRKGAEPVEAPAAAAPGPDEGPIIPRYGRIELFERGKEAYARARELGLEKPEISRVTDMDGERRYSLFLPEPAAGPEGYARAGVGGGSESGSGAVGKRSSGVPPGTQAPESESTSIRAVPSESSTARYETPSFDISSKTRTTSGTPFTESIVPKKRPQLQPSADVPELYRLAEDAKKDVDVRLPEILQRVGGAEVRKTRIKRPDGIERKLKDRAADEIADYLDARIAVDSPADMRRVRDAVASEFEVINEDDFLEAGKEGWRGIHLDLRHPNGLSFEVQLSPRELYEAKVAPGSPYLETYKKWQARIAEGTPLSPAEHAQLKADKSRQVAVYDDAFSRWKQKAQPAEVAPAPPAEVAGTPRSESPATEKPWEYSARGWLAKTGVHEPWIGEISTVQYAGLSKRGKAAYDAKRSTEWDTSSAAKGEWRKSILDAYDRGEINLEMPGLHKEARLAIERGLLARGEAQGKADLASALRKNAISDIGEVSIGDRVFNALPGRYGTVEKKFQTSVRLKYESGGDSATVPVRHLQRLRRDDVVKAEAAGPPRHEPAAPPAAEPAPSTASPVPEISEPPEAAASNVQLSKPLPSEKIGSATEITATLAGEKAGYIVYHRDGEFLHVRLLNVGKKYRRQGIATKLFEQMLDANPGRQVAVAADDVLPDGAKFLEDFKRRRPGSVAEQAAPEQVEPVQVAGSEVLMSRAEAKKFGDVGQGIDEGMGPAVAKERVGKVTRTAKVRTERGTEVDVKYRLVELDDLIASHDETLNVNPRYPAELQPRDRSRAASKAQIEKIATKLDPELLGASPKASEGAPIVGPKGKIVESGNARVIALKKAHEDRFQSTSWGRYYTWLEMEAAHRFGLGHVRSYSKPVLVRVRTSELADVKRFVAEANESGVAAMSSTEQALADAQRLSDSALRLLEPDELTAAGNRPFVKAFLRDAVGPTDLGRYVDASGSISQEGIRRIQNAVLAKAYGDADVLEKFTESTDSNIRNIAAGLLRAAPRQVALRRGVEAGELYDLALTEDLAAAVKKLSFLREAGTKVEDYVDQKGLFGADLSPEARQVLVVLNKLSRSPKQVGEFLDAYAATVEGAGNPKQSGLFAKESLSRSQALEIAIQRVDDLEASDGQPALFSDRTILERAKDAGQARSGDEAVLRTQPEEGRVSEAAGAGGARGGAEVSGGREPEPLRGPEAERVAETDSTPAPAPKAAEEPPKGFTPRVIEGGKSKPPPPTSSGPALEGPILKEPLSRRAVQATEDLFLSGKIERDPERLISDQVMEAIAEERVALPELEEVLHKRGLTFVDFAEQMFRPAVTDAARRLNALAILQRKINLLDGGKGAKGELKKLKAIATDLREFGARERLVNSDSGHLVDRLASPRAATRSAVRSAFFASAILARSPIAAAQAETSSAAACMWRLFQPHSGHWPG